MFGAKQKRQVISTLKEQTFETFQNNLKSEESQEDSAGELDLIHRFMSGSRDRYKNNRLSFET
jgi:hypothetical protein